MSDQAKSLLLGLAISNAIGPDVLLRAKEALGDEILREADLLTEAVQRLVDQEVGEPATADDAAVAEPKVKEATRGAETTTNGAPLPTNVQLRAADGGLPQTPQTPERSD